jgi:hypothetical protein
LVSFVMQWITLIALMGEPGALGPGESPGANAPGSPPIVGQPVDFSGAVGGPFVVQWIAAPTELTTEQPLTLTLRITGPGNLAAMPRPALGKLDSFRSFAVEDLDDRFVPGDPPRREFRYRLRPRSVAVTEIPRFKFVYFNPRIAPPSRGYQTTYADPVALTVNPRSSPLPADVPAWMLEPPTTDELFGPPRPLWRRGLDRLLAVIGVDTDELAPESGRWFAAVAVVIVPPLGCVAWLLVWRRRHPDAARLAAGRRSRAAAAALRAFARSPDAEAVASALIEYLRDRHGLPPLATTPGEIVNKLTTGGCPAPLATTAAELLRRCDAVRFGPAPATDPALAADAAKAVLDWEAAA